MTKARAIEWKMTKEEAIAMIEDDKKRHHDELSGRYRAALTMAIKALEQEPIIYCKDCKYWQDNNNGYPVTDCRWDKDETTDADDFCSFAERKDQ